MAFRVRLTLVGIVLTVAIAGCGDGKNHGVKLLWENEVDSVRPLTDPFVSGTDSSRSRVGELASMGPLDDNVIIVQQQDSLNLLSMWSGLSIEALIEDNPQIQNTGLLIGSGFLVRLPRSKFLEFSSSREAYMVKHRIMCERGIEITEEIEYVVQAGDTAASVVEKFGSQLELFEKLNPLAKNLSLKPGQKVRVPITSCSTDSANSVVPGRSGVRERLPGPPAPNPTPVPVPPSGEGRNLLVDSPESQPVRPH